MTNSDQSGDSGRLAPRPVERPPVDPAAQRAFGRPAGVDGSFLGAEKHRDQGEYTPKDQPPDPVLAEAFGRPATARESLQRHPTDAGALEAERNRDADDDLDPWRDPSAAVALGIPARPPAAPTVVSAPVGKIGVRDVLFGRRVSWVALLVLTFVALLIGALGGWVGNMTASTVHAFTTS